MQHGFRNYQDVSITCISFCESINVFIMKFDSKIIYLDNDLLQHLNIIC